MLRTFQDQVGGFHGENGENRFFVCILLFVCLKTFFCLFVFCLLAIVGYVWMETLHVVACG